MPPVTAERSPPDFADDRGGFAGDRRFVDGGDAGHHLAVRGDEVAGLDENDVADLEVEGVHAFEDVAEVFRVEEPLGPRVAAGPAHGVGLRLAASFGDGLGEVGEQHGEPQPGCDLAGEQGLAVARDEIAEEQDRDAERYDLGDEDHRVLGEGLGIELAEGLDRGPARDRRVEQAGG